MPVSSIEFSQEIYSVWENDSTGRVAITLTRSGDLGDLSNSASLDLSVTGYSINNVGPLGTLPVYFAPGEDTNTVYLNLNDDNLTEGTETVSLSLVNYDSNQIELGTQSTATLEVRDDETSYIEFSDVNYVAWENDFNPNSPYPNEVEITLSRTGDNDDSVSTDVEVFDSMGYSMGLFTADFGFNEATTSIYLPVLYDDSFANGSENFSLSLVQDPMMPPNPEVAFGDNQTATLEVRDDETSYIEFSDVNYVAWENDFNPNSPYPNEVEITLSRTGDIYDSVSTDVEVFDSMGYSMGMFTADFGFNEATTSIYLPVLNNDSFANGSENFSLSLVQDPMMPPNPEVAFGDNQTATLEVRDDETSYIEFSDVNYVAWENDFNPNSPYPNEVEITLSRTGDIYDSVSTDVEVFDSMGYSMGMFTADFGFNEATTSIYLPVLNNDSFANGSQTFSLSFFQDPMMLPDPEVAFGDNQTATLEVRDDETSYIEFSDVNYVAWENDFNPNSPYPNEVEITLSRTGDIYDSVSTDVEVFDSMGYSMGMFTADFGFNEATTSIYLPVLNNDSFANGSENFSLSFFQDPMMPPNPEVAFGDNQTATLEVRDDETSYIEFSDVNYVAWENDFNPNSPYPNEVEITLSRTGDIYDSVSTDVEVFDSMGYSMGMFTADFGFNEATTSIYLPVLNNDSFANGSQTFSLSFFQDPMMLPDPEVAFGDNQTATLEVRDDETSYIEFSDVNYVAWENDFNPNSPYPNEVEITLSRTGDIYDSVSTDVEVFDSMGYSMGMFTADFGFNEATTSIYLPVLNNDSFANGSQTFSLSFFQDPMMLPDPEVAFGDNQTATLEVRDDETSYIEFSDVNYVAWENDFNPNSPYPNEVEITLSRTGDIYDSVSTDVEVFDSMGYSMGMFTADFGFNEATTSIYLPVLNNDSFANGSQTFSLSFFQDPMMLPDPEVAFGDNQTATLEVRDDETSYIEFSDVNYVAWENDFNPNSPYPNEVEITLSRTGDIYDSVSTDVEVFDSMGYSMGMFTADFGFNEATTSIYLPVLNNDSFANGSENFSLSFFQDPMMLPDPEVAFGDNQTATLEVRDDETSYIEFSDVNYVAWENDFNPNSPYPNEVEITLSRTGDIYDSVSTDVEVFDSMGYSMGMFTADFGFNEATTSIYLPVLNNDSFANGSQTFSLSFFQDPMMLPDPEVAFGDNQTATLEVRDDETSYIEFSDVNYVAWENDFNPNSPYPNEVEITLSRTGDIYDSVSTDVEVFDSMGYSMGMFTADFGFNEATTSIYLPVLNNDSFANGSENFSLSFFQDPMMLPDPEVAFGDNQTATLEVRDDETSYIEFSDVNYVAWENDFNPNSPYPNEVEITLSRTGDIYDSVSTDVEVFDSMGYSMGMFTADFGFNEATTSIYLPVLNNDSFANGSQTFSLSFFQDPMMLPDPEVAFGDNQSATLEVRDDETSYIEFSDVNYVAWENDFNPNSPYPNEVEITLSRTGDIYDSVSTDVEVFDSMGYSMGMFTADFGFNEATTSIYLPVLNNDSFANGSQTFSLSFFQDPMMLPDPEVAFGDNQTATLEVRDDETSYIEFSDVNYVAWENDFNPNSPYPNEVEITLSRTGDIYDSVSTDVEVFDSMGYSMGMFTADFGFNEATTSIYLPVLNNDSFANGSENFSLSLVQDPMMPPNPEVAFGDNQSATLEVRDDETSYIEFSDVNYVAWENDFNPNSPYPNEVEITLSRTGDIYDSVSTDVEVFDSMGYSMGMFTADFGFNEATTSIYLPVLNNDSFANGSQTFSLSFFQDPMMLPDPEVAFGDNQTATLEVRDDETSYIEFSQAVYQGSDDSPNQVEITLTRSGDINSIADVEVLFKDGTATEAIDFGGSYDMRQWVNFNPGETTKTLTVDIYSDIEIEGIETVNFELIIDPYKDHIAAGSQTTATLEISDTPVVNNPISGSTFAGFETSDFTDWMVEGQTSIETSAIGVTPTEGTYQALISNGSGSVSDSQLEQFAGLNPGELDSLLGINVTEGSAIKRDITVAGGETVSFDWNFLTNEGQSSYYNDSAFVAISDGFSDKLADTYHQLNPSNTSLGQETGSQTFNHQFVNGGTYTLTVGVLDARDTIVDSTLLVDNFSIV